MDHLTPPSSRVADADFPLFPWMGSQPGSLWLCGGGRADQSRTGEGGAEVKGGGAWDEGRRDVMEQWKIPKRDRRMPLLFLSSFSFLSPDSHFCSVHQVPPSGSADDNFSVKWGFVTTPVLIIHKTAPTILSWLNPLNLNLNVFFLI